MSFSSIDIVVFCIYALIIIGIAWWVSRKKEGVEQDSTDYFLAGKSLPWYAIGASLIASNISAEQIIGMSGSGFAIGMAIAAYELMAAVTLLLVAKYLLPIYLNKKIFTMPQFLLLRYDGRVRTSLAVFWLLLYVFVNLTTVMFLGALALNTVIGIPFLYGILGLGTFALLYSIYGGLKAVAYTDIIQVIFLVIGGILVSGVALNLVSGGEGAFSGFLTLIREVPGKFDMVFDVDSTYVINGEAKSSYMDLPGISVLIGGMWIANLAYWGCNQYITQRALAAKNLTEARKGVAFAAFLKVIMPIFVVIPGVAAFYLVDKTGDTNIINAMMSDGLMKPDKSYPAMLSLVPAGLKGVTFAALIGAIISSLASMMNSTATIFTMDIYHKFINKNSTESNLVKVGRITSFVALAIACLVTPALEGFDQMFQYIQEFSGFVTPAVTVIFLFGMFWSKSTSNAALWVAVLSIPINAFFYFFVPEVPFIDRMGFVFIILCFAMIIISWIDKEDFKWRNQNFLIIVGCLFLFIIMEGGNHEMFDGTVLSMDTHIGKTLIHLMSLMFVAVALFLSQGIDYDKKAIDISKRVYKSSKQFNTMALIIVVLVTLIYIVWW
ncbi:MAG: sodium/sugar symporter [Imperialibacter sp.]|uniref:sodium/sugar symporter n=1 Tax=Imperialibacter sp. TaxID=2038411 RepID=UPI0032EFA82B